MIVDFEVSDKEKASYILPLGFTKDGTPIVLNLVLDRDYITVMPESYDFKNLDAKVIDNLKNARASYLEVWREYEVLDAVDSLSSSDSLELVKLGELLVEKEEKEEKYQNLKNVLLAEGQTSIDDKIKTIIDASYQSLTEANAEKTHDDDALIFDITLAVSILTFNTSIKIRGEFKKNKEVKERERKKHTFYLTKVVETGSEFWHDEETTIKKKIVGFKASDVLSAYFQVSDDLGIVTSSSSRQERYIKGLLNPKGEVEVEEEEITPKFPITIDQLSSVFKNTNEERLAEVVKAINKYSNKFEINSVERMSHFLGQIGHESGGFNAKIENHKYSENPIKMTFGKVLNTCSNCNGVLRKIKYSNLFEGYGYSSVIKVPTEIVVYNNKKKKPKFVIKENEILNFFSSYKIKQKYIKKPALLNYVYGGRMGNGKEINGSEEGYKYRGRGFIQLTGKNNYKMITDEWNIKYDDKKDFVNNEKDRDLIVNNVETALKVSLIFWEKREVNEEADKGMDDYSIERLGAKINGSGKDRPNGWKDRLKKTNKIYEELEK